MLVAGNALFTGQRNRLVALAAHHALPAIYYGREFVEVGGLMSYGASIASIHIGRSATTPGRILKGTKPADLPVQAPTKFELVVNVKTAKALGLYDPREFFLLRADEVIADKAGNWVPRCPLRVRLGNAGRGTAGGPA